MSDEELIARLRLQSNGWALDAILAIERLTRERNDLRAKLEVARAEHMKSLGAIDALLARAVSPETAETLAVADTERLPVEEPKR